MSQGRSAFLVALAALAASLTVPMATQAKLAEPVKQYRLKHPRHEHCKAHYTGIVEKVSVREHGRTVKVRETFCVYVAPKKAAAKAPATTPPATTTTATPTTPTPSTPAPVSLVTLHADLDPSFTQDSSNPLAVTYSYSASATETVNGVTKPTASLPPGVLNLYSEGLLKCSINVGGSITGGKCFVTYSEYGAHTVVVEYLSGTTNATTGNETETIEPPAITVRNAWGTTAPTNGPASTIKITRGSSAAVTLTDANFEGAISVGLTDNLGDTCTAPVTGAEASCSMAVTGAPSTLTVNYPGGTTTEYSQSVEPNGTRQVTEEWPGESVQVTPTVTVYHATVEWSGTAPPNPVHLTTSERLVLNIRTTGNYPGHEAPFGNIAFTVEGPGSYTTTNTLYGLNPEDPGSKDCSEVHNYSDQAEAQCELNFHESGTYTVKTAYHSSDPDYADREGPGVTVVVE